MAIEQSAQFAPLCRRDGYLPLEDYGLIGDGATSALVGRDGAIAWLCLPRFDSPPVFCSILDARRGGAFTIAPKELLEARQFYESDNAVLVTEMRCRSGLVRVEDLLTLQADADLDQDASAAGRALLRIVTVLEGQVRLRVELSPRGGAEAERDGRDYWFHCADQREIDIVLSSSFPLPGLPAEIPMKAGERGHVLLRWGSRQAPPDPLTVDDARQATEAGWRKWVANITYDGPQRLLVRRSAITLKLLDHFENGAIVAAPTSSLPEAIGGPRNWDYRYTWIRDAAFSVYALRRIGLVHEASGFLKWVLDAVDRDGRPKILYDLDGCDPDPERQDPDLEGYRRSQPVRWGNAAADQRQHDVYGEILDCAYQWARHYGKIEPAQWDRLGRLVEAARREWQTSDHGIWEVRTSGHPFTYSAALCQVALDRAARLAERFSLPGDAPGWRAAADRIQRDILERAWDAELNSLTEHLGGGKLDASLLALPLRRVIPADHPRMIATTEAVRRHLGAGQGLLYRYHPDESPDGLPGHEGAFLLCSFWLVDNLAKQGRVEEALELYDSLCARAGPLGLLPEQIDPETGAFLGNYPQAFSHIGVISSGVNLARIMRHGGERR